MTQTPKSQTEVILADQAEALPGQWTGADINLMHELWPKLDLTDFRTLLRVCIARGLNPLSDDVYPVVYNANKPRPIRKLVLIESIDSMRRRGHATEVVVEMKGPQFCSKEEPEKWVDVWTSEEMPFAARYWMKARHMDEGSWRVRLWSEVAKSGTGDEFWRSHAQGGQPVHMLGNAVERLQWRMTCPAIFSNMYGPEEMGVTNILSVPTSELSTWEPEALGPVVADEDGVIEDGAAPQPNSGDEETPAPTDIPAVFKLVQTLMKAAKPPFKASDLEGLAGWPEGASPEKGIAALLAGADGDASTLAGTVLYMLASARGNAATEQSMLD